MRPVIYMSSAMAGGRARMDVKGAESPAAAANEDEVERIRRAERERKKAEVRKRLEEAERVKKAKKGFLTPERKTKLRKMLMMKATEDLKLQQKRKAAERQRVLNERIPEMPQIDRFLRHDLTDVSKEYKLRILALESEIYDLNYVVRQKDYEINEITIAVNDLRGKFVKPSLKRISKTDTQFDKLKKQNEAKICDKIDYRSTLKSRPNDAKFTLEEEKVYDKPPEWAK